MMRDFYELATPVTINNSTIIGSGNVGTWVRDISLTAMGVSAGDIPAWATGVVFEIRNTNTSTAYGFGVQSADSTEDLVASEDNFLARLFVPLNATKTFDLYCGHLTNIVFKVIGFENFVQHVTPVDLSPQFLKGLEMGDAGIAGDNTGNLITVSAAPAGAKYALIEVRANKGMKLHGEGYSTFAMRGLHAAVSQVVVPLSAAKTFWMHSDNYRAENPVGSPDVDLPRNFPDNGIRFIGWVPEENYEHRPMARPFGSTTAQNGTWVKVPDSAFGLKLASLEHASGSSGYGWGVANIASGGENWSREPKADVWVSPNANGELWVIRNQSYEQSESYRARLTGGFIATPAGRITTVDGGDVLTAGATAVPVVGTGLSSASYAKLVLHAPSTHAHTTQALSVSGVSDTGLTIDAVTLGKMPYSDAYHTVKLQIFNSSNALIAEKTVQLSPPSGYVVLPTADADALSAAVLGILKPLAARSQAVMPSTVTHGGSARAVEYELSASGYWTGVISLGNYQPTTSVTLEGGTYRAGDATDAAGGWESLDLTLLVSTASDIALDDSTPNHLGSLTITGNGFGTTQGTGTVTIGGVSQTVTSWADTSITITVGRGTNKYGVALDLVVTNNDSVASTAYSVTLSPQAGWDYVNVGTPNPTASNRITATPDAVSGDQLTWDTQSGAVVVYNDLTFSAGGDVTSFDVELWTTGDGYGAAATQTVGSGGATAPVLSSITASASSSSINWGVSTDTADGSLRVLASANSTELAATVKASGVSYTVTASGAQSGSLTGLTDGDYYVHIVHVHDADSDVLSTAMSVTVPGNPAVQQEYFVQIGVVGKAINTTKIEGKSIIGKTYSSSLRH